MVEIEDSSFDGAFAIEATCHSKDLGLVYREIFRVLKPGALFADMAWCVTEDYDPQNSKHVKVIKDLMVSTITFCCCCYCCRCEVWQQLICGQL